MNDDDKLKDRDHTVFAFTPEMTIRILSKLEAAAGLAKALRAAMPHLNSPDFPPEHPAREVESDALKALVVWDALCVGK